MIKFGRIVDIIHPAQHGANNPQLVKASLPDTSVEVTAYAKKLSDLNLLVEIMTALIGREIGLPIPEPILLASKDNKELWFGSIDVKYPDLTHTITCSDGNNPDNTQQNLEMFKKLSEWDKATQAATFDEWIINNDRNLQNILHDGGDNFYLIDHDQAISLPFKADKPIQKNQLMNVKLLFTRDELGKQRLKNTMQSVADKINSQAPSQISLALTSAYPQFQDQMLETMVQFLENRLAHLASITESKVAPQQMSI